MSSQEANLSGYALPGVVIAACTVLHVLTPAFSVAGYVVGDDGKALVYRWVLCFAFVPAR